MSLQSWKSWNNPIPPFNLRSGNKKIKIGIEKANLPSKKSVMANRIAPVKIKYLIPFAIFLLLALIKKFNKRYKITNEIPMIKNKFIKW